MTLLADVVELKNCPSTETKLRIAEKIISYYNSGITDTKEKRVVHDIMYMLAHDADIRVRKCLAHSLRFDHRVPYGIIKTLIFDISEVAVPILEYVKAITDEDILEIIRTTQQGTKMVAISCRQPLPKEIVQALLDKGNEEAILNVVANSGAIVTETMMQALLEKYKHNTSFLEALIRRSQLPKGIMDNVVTTVSQALQEQLAQIYRLPSRSLTPRKMPFNDNNEARKVSSTSAFLPIFSSEKVNKAPHSESTALADYFYRRGKLTYSILLRALCGGDLGFFEAGLARLTGIPLEETHQALWNKNPAVFHALYEKAHMPANAGVAVGMIVKGMKRLIQEGKNTKDMAIRQQFADEMVKQGYDKTVPFMAYMVLLMRSELIPSDILVPYAAEEVVHKEEETVRV